MANLTEADMEEIARLGKFITADLSCDINGEGVPCHTDRLAAVANMIEYLRLHDYIVTNEGEV